jgi:lipopolysaccharide biosynthesis glycosyltransferase
MRYNVCLATDDGYAQHLATALTSLLINNKNINELDVYVLGNKLSEVNIEKINSIGGKFNRLVNFIDVINLEELIGTKVNVNALSITTYTRLFLGELLPKEVDVILYLDCDVIVDGNIENLWNCDINNNYIGGVIDTMYPSYFKDIDLPLNKYYVNAGVLLMNLKKWRNDNITKKFIQFIDKYNGNVPHLDQGVINGVFKDKLILDLKYNVQTPLFIFKKFNYMMDFYKLNNYYNENEWKEAKQNPIIIHYSSSYASRPWFKPCFHPKKNKYRSYKEKSPYRNNKLLGENISFFRKVKNFLMINFQLIYLIARKLNEK